MSTTFSVNGRDYLHDGRPVVVIDDAPRFAYRGVMLDVARHFHPVATVTAYIDRASSLKLNHLHLHLTDDQGWRLQLRSRPELTAHAAATSVGGDPGGFYTQDDFREIVTYAAAHHMTVVPEIDLPGHANALVAAYPELGNLDIGTPPTGPWERFGVNARTLAPTEEALAFGRAAVDALCDEQLVAHELGDRR